MKHVLLKENFRFSRPWSFIIYKCNDDFEWDETARWNEEARQMTAISWRCEPGCVIMSDTEEIFAVVSDNDDNSELIEFSLKVQMYKNEEQLNSTVNSVRSKFFAITGIPGTTSIVVSKHGVTLPVSSPEGIAPIVAGFVVYGSGRSSKK